MSDKLYDNMDWAAIEAMVYSEEDHPHDILGAKVTPDGVLVQAFFPGAVKVSLKQGTGSEKEMTLEDEAGFYATLLPGKTVPSYVLRAEFEDGRVWEGADPYNFEPQITEEDEARFSAGIAYEIYEKLGAHPMTIDGVSGVYFAVWAPNAQRVSVVGDFNKWDGRMLPMRRLPDSGIFELFVPSLKAGELYKYEIKAKGGLTYLKTDPYGFYCEKRPATASIVQELSYDWGDRDWMEQRSFREGKDRPMMIYEVHLGSFRKPEENTEEFFNYRELAKMIADHVKKIGYTHVQLMPVMEHPLDDSWGYQTLCYYAPTSRFGKPEDFMYMVDYLHQQGIGVILDWTPAYFPSDNTGLIGFDGTNLYEHRDPRQGYSPNWGTLVYNYGRPQVKNFLIANALFWAKVYHADGIHMNAVSSMLYLDYGRSDGQWVANMYGGNENLEAIEFIKHLNSIFHKEVPGAVLTADESSAWPKVTAPLDEEGLGFDFKWNNGWSSDVMSYMQLDPVFRSYHHGDLIFSMIYQYSEHFILALSHQEAAEPAGSLLSKMPGKREMKLANLRTLLGYMILHPGKKLLFMGQDFGDPSGWSHRKAPDWMLTDAEGHAELLAYMQELVSCYKSHPALYGSDDDPDGFEWINSISANENLIVFLRKHEEEVLLCVCNFSPLVYENRKIGVPFVGKYKEIFNSDAQRFGGKGCCNPRVKASRFDECDGREESIRIKVPPMGIAVFAATRADRAESGNEKARKNGRSTGRKNETRKNGSARKTSLKDELRRKIEESEHL